MTSGDPVDIFKQAIIPCEYSAVPVDLDIEN